MNFNFFMPVKLVSGENCICKNKELFNLGRKCLIVTGKQSAKLCGALDDVINVLTELNIQYEIYNKISENPLVSICYEGGQIASRINAEFIIGIGGGSPLDAAKAISAYATNKNIDALDIYSKTNLNPSLPIIAIPTTAGTGSEANPYSVMTLDGQSQKKTFTSAYSYPRYAFLDAKYTYSLSTDYTISTALDAFCHCIESYMSPKSTDMSEMFALYGAKQIWDTIIDSDSDSDKNCKTLTPDMRTSLMYAACAAGIAINTTGTGFPHPLGYNLTLFSGIPHGRACAIFLGEYIKYNEKVDSAKTRLNRLYSYMNISDSDIKTKVPKLANVNLNLDNHTIDLYIEKVKSAGNFKNSFYVINESEMKTIYQNLNSKCMNI